MLYKLAVTGNICSGKSACVKYLSKLPHVKILNLDILGHVVYERNPYVMKLLKNNFQNQKIFEKEKSFFEILNRKELGKIVFDDKVQLDKLNNIMRPELKKILLLYMNKIETENKLLKNKNKILVVEGAIIIEAGFKNLFDETWMAIANKEEIEKRFMKRLIDEKNNKYDKTILEKILKMQMPDQEKAKLCDHIIDTSDLIEKTQEKYFTLYNNLIDKLN